MIQPKQALKMELERFYKNTDGGSMESFMKKTIRKMC